MRGGRGSAEKLTVVVHRLLGRSGSGKGWMAEGQTGNEMSSPWYQNAVVYSLDVEPPFDSDGSGDFVGIMKYLDYLVAPRVTCLLPRPFYPSPNQDNGYDGVDPVVVDPRLGPLGDFAVFMREARECRFGGRPHPRPAHPVAGNPPRPGLHVPRLRRPGGGAARRPAPRTRLSHRSRGRLDRCWGIQGILHADVRQRDIQPADGGIDRYDTDASPPALPTPPSTRRECATARTAPVARASAAARSRASEGGAAPCAASTRARSGHHGSTPTSGGSPCPDTSCEPVHPASATPRRGLLYLSGRVVAARSATVDRTSERVACPVIRRRGGVSQR